MAKKRKIQGAEAKTSSHFDGKLSGQIGTTILMLFALLIPLLPAGGLAVLGFTLFADLSKEILIVIYVAIGVFAFFMLLLGLAWATVISLRWEYRHTVIDGKRLVFKGKKTALWGNYLKWFFLSVITILLYTFWIGAKFGKWVLKNVETVESEEKGNTEKDAMNAYLPTANPYFPPYPTYPNYPPMPNMPQAGNAQGAQMPNAYFPPYPYFPPYAPYPCVNEQCKKEN